MIITQACNVTDVQIINTVHLWLIDIINADKHWSNAGLVGTAPSIGKQLG